MDTTTTKLALGFTVLGDPAPQGSKNVSRSGHMYEASKKLKPWRREVSEAARAAKGVGWSPLLGPVLLGAQWTFQPPQGRIPAHRLGRPATYNGPDLSKLIRAIEDGLTEAGIWKDDGQITGYRGMDEAKLYVGAPGALNVPGVAIWIWEVAA